MPRVRLVLLFSGLAVVSLALAHGAFFSSTTVTPVGWAAVDLSKDGTSSTLTSDGATSLPNYLTASVNNGQFTVTAAAGSVASVSDGVVQDNVRAKFLGSYRIVTDEPLPASESWIFSGTETVSAYAQGRVGASGCQSQALGVALGGKSNALAQIPTQTMVKPKDKTDQKTPPSKKFFVPLSLLTWLSDGGKYSCTAKIVLGTLGGNAVPRGSGTPTQLMTFGAEAAGSGGIVVSNAAAKPNRGTGTVTINVPYGRDAVEVDLYDASGNPVDQCACISDGSNAYLPIDNYAPGTYTLAFSVDGSLVKKMVVTLDPNDSPSFSPVFAYGDLDGDNVVTQAEVDFIAAHVGHTISDDDAWPTFDSPYILKTADLDGDGYITQADVALAQANVGVHGD